MIASRLREADILYQLAALEPASERLRSLTRTLTREGPRLGALCRLTEIACDMGELTNARQLLAEMRRCAERLGHHITVEDRAELSYAMARYAFSRRDGAELERRARDAVLLASRAPGNDRVSSLAIRIGSYLAVDRYHRQNLAGAGDAAKTAAKALRDTPGALPYVKTHALTTRAVIDLHDPARAHLATAENIEALELALASGMISTAQDALFNIVNFRLYCDDWSASPHESRVVRENLDDALVAPSSSDDPVLAALLLCSSGRYAEAVDLLERATPHSRDKGSEWLPMFLGPVALTKRARILFKAGRFAQAEGAAADALDAWDQSGLGGHGTALRIRAEALEALGEARDATEAIENAIGALEPMMPVHHMVGAYKCAHRLTKKPAYLDRARYLIAALKKTRPQRPRLTPREREVALLVAQGHTNKAIATRLNIGTRTVENHVASIFEGLEIRARWQLTPDMI